MSGPDSTPRHRLLHLSDTHVGADGSDEDGVDAARALTLLLASLEHLPDLDAVLVTGDIADDGSRAGCEYVRDAVGAFARERGVPQFYTTGNHDHRDSFTAVFGHGHLTATGEQRPVDAVGGEERAAVGMLGDLRIVTLDSLVPGQTHGELSAGQRSWLREVLREPAPAGTVLAFHHPPAFPAGRSVEHVVLQDIDAFAAVVAGSDVRAVLTGHLHLQLQATLVGIPVWVTPGVVTRIDLTARPHHLRGVLGAGATLVELGGPFSPVFTVLQARDPRADELVYLVDQDTGADVCAEDGR